MEYYLKKNARIQLKSIKLTRKTKRWHSTFKHENTTISILCYIKKKTFKTIRREKRYSPNRAQENLLPKLFDRRYSIFRVCITSKKRISIRIAPSLLLRRKVAGLPQLISNLFLVCMVSQKNKPLKNIEMQNKIK